MSSDIIDDSIDSSAFQTFSEYQGEITLQPCKRIDYGCSHYPFKREIQIITYKEFNDTFICMLSDYRDFVTGSASSPEKAKQAFDFQFHQLYQTTSALAPFERAPKQQRQWECFNSLIDHEKFLQENPQRCHLKGQIQKKESETVHVCWLGGRINIVSYADAPSNFILFEEKDWFDATIDRDWDNERIIKIVDAIPCKNPNLTPEEENEFWRLVQ